MSDYNLTFLPLFSNGFSNWVDDLYVIKNDLLRGPDWKGIFTQQVTGNCHPLTIITCSINYSLKEISLASFYYYCFGKLKYASNDARTFIDLGGEIMEEYRKAINLDLVT